MKKQNFFGNEWKDYFSLPNQLRKSMFVLFSVLSIEIIFLAYLHFTPVNKSDQDIESFKNDIDNFLTASADSLSETTVSYGKKNKNNSQEIKPSKAELFPFNPNNLPEKDWQRLGFSERQIQVIKNYESKGGKFFSKEDVKKMYSISENEFKRIEPYIVIPVQKRDTSPDSKSLKKTEKPFLIVDIGTADTTEFEKLYGIGPVKARIIVNYREKLGGFYSINQLHEVWGIDDSLFQNIKPHLVLNDSTNLRKIDLNKAEFQELNSHPYLKKNLANVIINYRKQHGTFHSLNELLKIPLVNEELYAKIAHYLKIDN